MAVDLDGHKIAQKIAQRRKMVQTPAQDGTKITSKLPKDGPRKEAERCEQDVSTWPQDGPEMAEDGPKMGRRWPQDGPKMGQDGPKMGQDGPKMGQDGPRWPQEGPGWPQDGPRWPEIAPTWPQEALPEALLGPSWGSKLGSHRL